MATAERFSEMGEKAAGAITGDNKKKWPWMAGCSAGWQHDIEQDAIFLVLGVCAALFAEWSQSIGASSVFAGAERW